MLVDLKKKVQRHVEGLEVRLSVNRRLEPAWWAVREVVFCVGGVVMRASARIGHDKWCNKMAYKKLRSWNEPENWKLKEPKVGKIGEGRLDVKN